jgi:hypothetical protein
MTLTPEQKYLADLDLRTEQARRAWLELSAARSRLLASGVGNALELLLELESVVDAERKYRSLLGERSEAHAQHARAQQKARHRPSAP